MKKFTIFIFLISFASFAKTNLSLCSDLLYSLDLIAKHKVITDSDFTQTSTIFETLVKNKCMVDFIELNNLNDSTENLFFEMTHNLGQICSKYPKNEAVILYTRYMNATLNSAEEERACSFERVFRTHPKDVFTLIFKGDSIVNKSILADIAWGFVNNHYYGLENQKAFNSGKLKKQQKPFLTHRNYKTIFYQSLAPYDSIFINDNKTAINLMLKEIESTIRESEEIGKGK